MTSTTTLRSVLNSHDYVVVPGVGTPLEARVVAETSFPCLYLSGYATAAAIHGVPDIGLIARAEMTENLRRVVSVTDLPVIVDADTGYGDATGVAATVREMEAIGAAGIQIEDQIWPKRCGHLEGKEVVERGVMLRKISAAVEARKSSETLIIARTDALAPLGVGEAIARGQAYAAAGADLIFVDAPASVEDLKAIAGEVTGVPLIVNVSEGGRTPALPAREYSEMGFKVILYPSTGIRVAAAAWRSFFSSLVDTEDSRDTPTPFMAFDDFNQLLGYTAVQEFEQRILAQGQNAGDSA
jgi:2-methylisocitrate lyase-like PEP mutase family enzyme